MLEDKYILLFSGTLLVILLTVFIILFVILYSRAQLKFKLERQQFQQALLETEVEIRKETLSNVARDLHDNFGQIASLIKINLSMVSEDQKPEDHQRIKESTHLLRQLINDIRGLSTTLLNQEKQDFGLVEKITADVKRINYTGFLKLEFHHNTEHIDIPPEIGTFLYRMFQEMINNVLKHSKADEAIVILNLLDKDQKPKSLLTLSVRDNGKGFALSNGETIRDKPGGNGLVNIEQRCRIIGATYTIDSLKNKGTFIEVNYPLKTHETTLRQRN